MQKGTLIGIAVVLVLLLAGAFFWFHQTAIAPSLGTISTTGSTTALAPGQIAGRPETLITSQGVKVNYYSDTYGLATTQDQIPKSVVPACEQGFDYCFYRVATDFKDTNLESAGLALKVRADLTTKEKCLTTKPVGFDKLVATTTEQGTFATSGFAPLSDAGAGHYSSGAQYRLWSGTSCTEFTTRIGETQFANYPPGTKIELTKQNEGQIKSEINSLLFDVKLNNQDVKFPGI